MVLSHGEGGGGVPSGIAIALDRPRYMLALLITSWILYSVMFTMIVVPVAVVMHRLVFPAVLPLDESRTFSKLIRFDLPG